MPYTYNKTKQTKKERARARDILRFVTIRAQVPSFRGDPDFPLGRDAVAWEDSAQ